jgi:hypothetical protein
VRAYVVSLGQFAWATVKLWWAVIVGVGFAAVGVAQADFHVPLTIPTPVAFGGAAFTWFLAAGKAYHDVRLERDAALGIESPRQAFVRLARPLIVRGRHIWTAGANPSATMERDLKWGKAVTELLEGALGLPVAVDWSDSPFHTDPPATTPQAMAERRVAFLQDLVDRVESLAFMDDWNPNGT